MVKQQSGTVKQHTGETSLKMLFSSAIRADVLALLLNNPDEKFYVREIANLIRKNPSGVKRELDNLEKMGILLSHRVANLRYFQANKMSPLFSELKNLIDKSLGLPGALKTIVRLAGAKAAFLYGPYADGEDVGSVDLFIIGASSNNIGAGLKELEEKFSKKINYTVIDESEYKNRKEKGDVDLEKLLSGKRITLIGRM
ncbi:MAG: winged helix-turn-helix transcriptional regulator [Nitrospirae bacterium]|nr:winged helix-turn-helix transcriptional regulator [Nitrospirota bacterium]